MSIISTIGRKQTKVRALFFGMYVFLVIGGATMIYPFLLMISGSTKSAMDIRYFDMYPRFLYDRDWMAAKHLEGLFNESLAKMKYAYNEQHFSYDTMENIPVGNSTRADAWERFVKETPMPNYSFCIGYLYTPSSKTIPGALRELTNRLEKKYNGDLTLANRMLMTEFISWNSITVGDISMLVRRNRPQNTPFSQEVYRLMAEAPVGLRTYFSVRGYFIRTFLRAQYSQKIKGKDGIVRSGLERYNEAHGTSYADWKDVPLPRRCPADGPAKAEWERFVREILCSAWIRVDATALADFQKYLKAKYPDGADGRGLDVLNKRYEKEYSSFEQVPIIVCDVAAERESLNKQYHGNIAEFNTAMGTHYASFEEIPLEDEPPFEGFACSDWNGFLTGYKNEHGAFYCAPLSSLVIHSVDTRFQDWMMATYGSLEAANKAMGTQWKTPDDIQVMQKDSHLTYLDDHIGDLRMEFVTRNYKTVFQYMLFHGRGILNTIIFCGLSILVALLVNPLAAYAMSRYRMPSTYKILLFLMCTMAFPPMVTGIPNFIMLRQFNMLNTFWALILPGMANGYSIFLLKGFFDSLPQELYESAQLDGANEWTLFWQITMGLSKPILAVIALNAFMSSYAAFMYAFVICQDRKMWTMMVWLYEMQQNYGQGVVYASLVIAAIPTFLIFLFCQNIIMRGIVVPTEK